MANKGRSVKFNSYAIPRLTLRATGIAIIYALLLAAILSVTQATLIVHPQNETSVSFKAVYAPTAPNPFNLTGRLYVMQTSSVEELLTLDLEGVIVLGPQLNQSIEVLRFSQAVYEGKGLGYIGQYSLYITSFSRVFPLPFLNIILEDAAVISEMWIKSNGSLDATIISDDNELIEIGKSCGSVFLIVITMAVLLVTLAYVSYQLHSFREGASVTKVALLCVLLANLGLIAERIVMFLYIYTMLITTVIPLPISVIGPMFIAFSAIFISLYWSTLAFPTQIKMKSKQVFIPILVFAVVSLVAYTVTFAAGVGNATYAIQVTFVVLIWVSGAIKIHTFIRLLLCLPFMTNKIVATYFIVIGGILIQTLNKGNKIIASKRKITKRLTYMLILTGVSMFGIVAVGLFMSLYYGQTSAFYTTRAILSLFCACSILTLAALFKKPKKQNSSGAGAGTSGQDDRTTSSRLTDNKI